MTALSELIQTSKVDPARAIERIAKSSDHKMDRATIYRYVEGRHPERPKEKFLQALAYGFELRVTDVRHAAGAAPGELGPWTPPIESGRLPKPVRDALDELIISLAKAGTAHGNNAAQKTHEDDQVGVEEAVEEPFTGDPSDLGRPSSAP